MQVGRIEVLEPVVSKFLAPARPLEHRLHQRFRQSLPRSASCFLEQQWKLRRKEAGSARWLLVGLADYQISHLASVHRLLLLLQMLHFDV